MQVENSIINRVAQSGLITLDLENFLPKSDIIAFDIKPFLFKELILKEKDFREALDEIDWADYSDKLVALYCSNEAIIPNWAYMLIVKNLNPFAKEIVFGDEQILKEQLILKAISRINIDDYRDQNVIIKGCGDNAVSTVLYVEITKLLQPVVKKLMYGEACSNVPIYKKKQ